MKIKTSTLTGAKLAYWTARAQKFVLVDHMRLECDGPDIHWKGEGFLCRVEYYRPDINAGQAMELQKAFKIGTSYNEETRTWFANALILTEHDNIEISICRAVVASIFGEFVEDKQQSLTGEEVDDGRPNI